MRFKGKSATKPQKHKKTLILKCYQKEDRKIELLRYFFETSIASLRFSVPLYNALPVITPITPASSRGNKFFISSIVETPPEAITGIDTASARRLVSSIFVQVCIPSLSISVKFIATTPQSSNFFAESTALI